MEPPFCVWAEDGENGFNAGDRKAEQAITGTVDYYTPQEYEKYKNAAVYTCGNYVIYTIMTPEDSASLLSGIRAILTD